MAKPERISVLGARTMLVGMLMALPATAQVQNPIQVFKDSYKKAKEQQQAKPQTQLRKMQLCKATPKF